jgi:hypothetical protein
MRGSWPIEIPCIQSTNTTQNHLSFYPISLFPSTSPRSSSVLHGWRIDDDDALERSGQLGQPITAARPDGSLPGVWGFGSQQTSLVCPAYRAPGEAPLATCPAYRARCGHPLGADRSLNWPGPISSDLALYRVCDLIKRQ